MRTLTAQRLQSCAKSPSITFARAGTLSSGATASSRSRKTTSAPSDAAFSIARRFVPGTASSLRCSRARSAISARSGSAGEHRVEGRKHPIGGLTVGVHTHQPDSPDRGRGGAEPSADLDAELAQEPRLNLFPVDDLGDVHRGELPQLMVGVGQERVPPASHLLLEVAPGVLVSRPALL